ncbi:MAG: hypothetical protein ABJL67_22195 [Sulfitobacter sp.]
MAKKPSPAELKKQGEELAKTFGAIRKTEHNFAMQIGKEGIVFMADRKKPADALWRMAKKDGGSSKGAKGTCTMKGKMLVLTCDDPDGIPTNLMRLAKVHFSERNQSTKVVLAGEEEGDDEEATEETGEEATAGGGSEASAGDADGGGDATAAADEEAPTEGGGGESLLQRIQREFEELQPDLEAAEGSPNKGVVKKVGGLKKMFEGVVESDQKKAGAIIGLLRTTIQSARDAGDIAEAGETPAAPDYTASQTSASDETGDDGAEAAVETGTGATAPDPAAVEARRSKLAELERGVDELLAEFA